jgi:alkylation response protein AidB-like acyl-CoA dehydrogenase
VINGQKVFTTAAHFGTHVWLAARTAPDRELKHRGLSVLIVPLDTPGITVRPLYTQADIRTNEVFFEDVRVPAGNRVGQENGGWAIITMALDFERILPYAGLAREFEELLAWSAHTDVDGDGKTVLEDTANRHALCELAVDLEIGRLFSLRTAWMVEEAQIPNAEASISKIWLSELHERLASCGLGLMGEEGQYRVGTEDAPLSGNFDQIYRAFPPMKFGAGTNEIQRNIIAQRGLGLPRS